MKRKVILAVFAVFFFFYVSFWVIFFSVIEYEDNAFNDKMLFPGLNTPICACAPTDVKALGFKSIIQPNKQRIKAYLGKDVCLPKEDPSANIKMYEEYQKMKISYPQYLWIHTGWLQPFDIKYRGNEWDKEPLEVFIILHSHVDPGWLWNYSTYFNRWAREILTKAMKNLQEHKDLKFVWAEVIFLRDWYKQASVEERRLLKKLLKNGQLEILTGGSVMTDEAVAHYHGMLDQLMEGQLWLKNELDYVPQSAWAIDPFGHSSTMPYLLKGSSIENMLIQRVHYATKKHLADQKNLEFRWRQTWDTERSTEIFCHLMPFLSYSIVYSCGPDIDVCCQFDFSDNNKCWKWAKYVKAEQITEENVEAKATLLLDQYRKKSQLFVHNVLLVPHGDDIRFSGDEWTTQRVNLQKLMTYINSRQDWNTVVKFGTVSDYFDRVRLKSGQRTHDKDYLTHMYPSLNGDFMTYNDRDDQYWSGFYTSRPFLKYMTRHLESKLRAAEIIYTLALTHTLKKKATALFNVVMPKAYTQLKYARRVQGLVQHHDAITGTAKYAVNEDYLGAIGRSLKGVSSVISQMAAVLLEFGEMGKTKTVDIFQLLDGREHFSQVPSPVPVNLRNQDATTETVIVVYNSLTFTRKEMVRVSLQLSEAHDGEKISVVDSKFQNIDCQIAPLQDVAELEFDLIINEKNIEVVFIANVPALSLRKYIIRTNTPWRKYCDISNITISSLKHAHHKWGVFKPAWIGASDFSIQNHQLRLVFCKCSGLLKAITDSDGITHKTEMRFVKYGTDHWNPWRDKSGAYVFLPDGEAKVMNYLKYTSFIIQGPVVSYVAVRLPLVWQIVSLLHVEGPEGAAVHLENYVNIAEETNTELAIRLKTSLQNTGFYTDLNGFQMTRRKTQSRIPIQGNFYPMTTMMYIEDKMTRISILSGQSHGVSALEQGWMEVMLDRTLAQDDWRGLHEGVEDNQMAHSRFKITVESRNYIKETGQKENIVGLPSIHAAMLEKSLNYPIIGLVQNSGIKFSHSSYSALTKDLPCDIHLLNFKTIDVIGLENPHTYLILHRTGVDCQYKYTYYHCQQSDGKIDWNNLFTEIIVKESIHTTLTGTHAYSKAKENISYIPPMHIKTYNLSLELGTGLH